ncbi:helicase HerA domain-containing protein [Helicobacter pullorum]|uniref:helicase HerA domain-containing protein n=1 Tax=Helicobacter pullorum TaxID=35818 RepID=UPI001D49D3A9|nr:DUF87 domain-containing protein [Helicobacter pullorum]HJF83458.1 hypothetical protein [Helicobacter pullorum]
MKNTNTINEFFGNISHYYFNNKKSITTLPAETLNLSDFALYKVDSITFKKDSPKREALENVLSALRIEGINFIYLILGNEDGIEFYYGISRDYSKPSPHLNIKEIGKFILEPSIKGNFRGSQVQEIVGERKRAIVNKIKENQYQSVIEGVPGVLKEQEEFQGVDRLADVMGIGCEFGLMIIASLVEDEAIYSIEKNIFELYNLLASQSKESIQKSKGKNSGTNTSKTTGENTSQTTGTNTSETKGYNESENKSETTSNSKDFTRTKGKSEMKQTTEGTSEGDSRHSTNKGSIESYTENKDEKSSEGGSKSQSTTISRGESYSKTEVTNDSKTTGTNTSFTEGSSSGENEGEAITRESINKQAQDWLKYVDDILLPRIDYGKGNGLFVSSMFCFANSKAVLTKLENTIISLFGGESGNKLPLRAFMLENDNRLESFRNLQLPKIQSEKHDDKMNAFLSQVPNYLGNWISAKELSLIADLPKKEVMGLELKEEVEFGLNFKVPNMENALTLGYLMQSGNITSKQVSIDKANLDKHIFITGVTGSGKTTTCQNILINSNKPFLVIEPAKTEYRILKNKYEDLLIFTLGKDTIAPFRLNPFEFFPHESITSRVDMIKASIEASFDMEAAIPQIIESAIYECYKDKGWNIATNQNEIYGDDAFKEGVYSFPTLSDLTNKIQEVVNQQGFDERLKNDYIGSIKARLNGLLVGSKGFMLNTKRSIDFRKLLDKRVVFELEEIRNGNEKSLVMGFILSNFIEAIKANFKTSQDHSLKHILLIEEAHRLLSKYESGDSLNKKQGVEVFADMLAEIRKYGECLMIADQIPNKLIPEVLKNTNTKIVHRIFAADDKKAIANTMALEEEQAEFLSKLDIGSAIVFSGGFNKAVAIQMNQLCNTTSNEFISEETIQEDIYDFYAQNHKDGVILGSYLLSNVDGKKIGNLLELQRKGIMGAIQSHWKSNHKIAPKLRQSLENVSKDFEFEFLVQYFMLENNMEAKSSKYAYEFLEKYLQEKMNSEDVMYFKDNLF